MKVFLVFILIAVLPACAVQTGQLRDGVVELVEADHNHRVNLAVGQTVAVRLDANRTTGYTWLLANGAIANGTLVPLHPESRYDKKIDGIYSMGVGAIEVWEFKALKAGEGVLRLEYRRPFEKGVEPLQVMEFPVSVTAP